MEQELLFADIAGVIYLPDSKILHDRDVLTEKVLVSFPSGNPWIISKKLNSSVRIAHAKVLNRCAAIIGEHSVSDFDLENALFKPGLDSVFNLHRKSIGSSILSIFDDSDLYFRPPVFGSKKLWYTTTTLGNFCSDNGFLLIQFAKNPKINYSNLSAHLIEPIPRRLTELPLIEGINLLPLMSVLKIKNNKLIEISCEWKKPGYWCSFEQASEEIYGRLRDAVRIRVADVENVSGDFSGGYDSTSLCVLASQFKSIVGITFPGDERSSEDVHWAKIAAAEISNIEHVILQRKNLPFTYSNLLDKTQISPDLPSIAVTGRSRILAVTECAKNKGSLVHLAGHGGDHLFSGTPTYFHSSFIRSPLSSYLKLREFALLFGWSRLSLAKALLERKKYSKWWGSQCVFSEENFSVRRPQLGWFYPLIISPWTSTFGCENIEKHIDYMFEIYESIDSRGLYVDFESICEGTRTARAISQIGETNGIPIVSPFTDDNLVEACLATKPHLRISALEYKPLLRSVMKGIAPEKIFTRNTKDEGSFDVTGGLHRYQDELQEFWQGSLLSENGLIDGHMLSELCKNPSNPKLQNGAMYSTIGAEIWARTASELIKKGTKNNVHKITT